MYVVGEGPLEPVILSVAYMPCVPLSGFCVVFFLLSSVLVSVAMLYIIFCILCHCVGEVCSCILPFIGLSSSCNIVFLLVQLSLMDVVDSNAHFCCKSSHFIMNQAGVSGILGLTKGVSPLGGFFFSIAVVNSFI